MSLARGLLETHPGWRPQPAAFSTAGPPSTSFNPYVPTEVGLASLWSPLKRPGQTGWNPNKRMGWGVSPDFEGLFILPTKTMPPGLPFPQVQVVVHRPLASPLQGICLLDRGVVCAFYIYVFAVGDREARDLDDMVSACLEVLQTQYSEVWHFVPRCVSLSDFADPVFFWAYVNYLGGKFYKKCHCFFLSTTMHKTLKNTTLNSAFDKLFIYSIHSLNSCNELSVHHVLLFKKQTPFPRSKCWLWFYFSVVNFFWRKVLPVGFDILGCSLFCVNSLELLIERSTHIYTT